MTVPALPDPPVGPDDLDLVAAAGPAVLALDAVLDQLDVLAMRADALSRDPGALPEVARVLLGLRALQAHLRSVEAELEAAVGKAVAALPGSLLPVEGYGVVQGKWAAPARTITDADRRAMASAVAQYAREAPRLVFPGTGEVEDEATVLLRLILEAFRLEPRKTALRPMGVDTADYGETRGAGRFTARTLAND